MTYFSDFTEKPYKIALIIILIIFFLFNAIITFANPHALMPGFIRATGAINMILFSFTTIMVWHVTNNNKW